MAHIYKEAHRPTMITRDEPDYFDESEVVESSAGVLEQLVFFLGGVVMTLLAVRFLLAILGANTVNAFVRLIYNVTQPLLAPFYSIFNYHPSYGVGRFEFESLFAILIYGLVAVGLAELIAVFDRRHYQR